MASTLENRSMSTASMNRPSSPSYQNMQQRNSIFKSSSELNATARDDTNLHGALDTTLSTNAGTIVRGSVRACDGDPLSLRNRQGHISFLMGVKPPSDKDTTAIIDQPPASPRGQVPSPSRHSNSKLQVIGGVQCCESEGADSDDDDHATSGSLVREDGRLLLRRRNSQEGAMLFAPEMTSLLPNSKAQVRRADSSRSSGSVAVTNSGTTEVFYLA
eukprot:GILJ01017572.1.p1 GENE.GILJ01017572.1~~GILJ01017572.1.p1  ORF type:complete len:216 (+),score=24.50 GILJ01017572.1:280-927(+)